MIDTLRHLLYNLLIVAVVAAVWITAWAQAAFYEEGRAWWPARDPALARRTFEKALEAQPPADPRHPAHFGARASLHELLGCE